MIGPSLGPMVGSAIVKSALGWYVEASPGCRMLADFAPQALDRICYGHRLACDRCDHFTSTARDILTNPFGQQSFETEAYDPELGAAGQV